MPQFGTFIAVMTHFVPVAECFVALLPVTLNWKI